MKFVDLLLYSEEGINDFDTLYARHRSNLGYLDHLPVNFDVLVIQHANFSAELKRNNIKYKIIKSNNAKWRLPIRLFLHLRTLVPDVILIHSMVFSWQIIFLGLIKNKRSRLIVQNHAEQPGGPKRRVLEKLASRCIDGFLFVNKTQAAPWLQLGVITDHEKIFEVMEGSTYFEAALEANRPWGPNFLWVGRLNRNKDPLTILKGFLDYSKVNRNARLTMIYNGGDLLSIVENFINTNNLGQQVLLLENVSHDKMQTYYHSADYFLLGSHYESGGYALCEAMACGCVPIVAEIPSFSTMVANGKEGFLFKKGDDRSLLKILEILDAGSYQEMRKRVLEKFENALSFQAIAKKIAKIAEKVA